MIDDTIIDPPKSIDFPYVRIFIEISVLHAELASIGFSFRGFEEKIVGTLIVIVQVSR